MKYQALFSLIESSKKIVVFGGAGTSTESNVPDFRSENGLYSMQEYGVSPEEILSHQYFYTHPDRFYDFLKKHLMLSNIKPHKGHHALVYLESHGLNTIITQNIDGLHQAAGSKNVLELHGSLDRHFCINCHSGYDADWIRQTPAGSIKCPKCGGLVKPDVVLYGESLDQDIMSQSVKALSEADLLIVAGTSLVVYPASSFIRFYRGKNLVLINKSETPYDRNASHIIRDSFGEVFSEIQSAFEAQSSK